MLNYKKQNQLLLSFVEFFYLYLFSLIERRYEKKHQLKKKNQLSNMFFISFVIKHFFS